MQRKNCRNRGACLALVALTVALTTALPAGATVAQEAPEAPVVIVGPEHPPVEDPELPPDGERASASSPPRVSPPTVIVEAAPPSMTSKDVQGTAPPAAHGSLPVPRAEPALTPADRTLELSVGFSGLLSGAWMADHVEVHASSGLDLSLRVMPWLYVGARRVGVAWASSVAGDRFAIGGAPMLGFALELGEVIELFAEVGAALQTRFGDQLGGSFGVAPFGGAGVRFRVAEWISLGLEGTAHVPVTDVFLAHNAIFPRGAVWFAGGVGVLFHIR